MPHVNLSQKTWDCDLYKYIHHSLMGYTDIRLEDMYFSRNVLVMVANVKLFIRKQDKLPIMGAIYSSYSRMPVIIKNIDLLVIVRSSAFYSTYERTPSWETY